MARWDYFKKFKFQILNFNPPAGGPMKYFFVGIFLILASLFLIEYRIVGQAVYGDGRYYLAFTRSLYFNHNIDISDEMAHFYSPQSNNVPAVFRSFPSISPTTRFVTASFSLGASVIWLPFYFLADCVVVFLNSLGFAFVRNGYSDIYQIVLGIGNILYVISGIFILFRILQRFFPVKVVMMTTFLLIFATNLLYYGGIDVVNSHPFSFFGSSLLLWFFFAFQKREKMMYLAFLGIIAGLLVANRTQDSLLVFLPLSAILLWHNKKSWIVILKKLGIFTLAFFLGYLPQFFLISVGQGRLAFLPHSLLAFTYPRHTLEILFDPKLGIALYMPVFLLGAVGLVFFYKRNRKVTYIFVVLILLQFLLIASWQGWQQASYTMRYFISLLPFISFGIAEMLSIASKRFSRSFLYLVIGIFVIQQCIMILGFKLFLQDPTNVGGEISRSGKLKMQIIRDAGKFITR